MTNSIPTARSFAVVTGASCGIGYELARQFVEHNFDVLVTAEDDGIGRAATRLARSGASIEFIQLDLSCYEGVEKFYGKIMACGRPVDAIAINPAVGVSGNFAKDTELKAQLNLITLNVISSVHLAKRILVDMVDRKQGRILFTSSITGTIPAPFEPVYAASKAFLLSFSEALRGTLQDFGVTVTALMPPETDTNFLRSTGISEKEDPADVARDGFEALMAGSSYKGAMASASAQHRK